MRAADASRHRHAAVTTLLVAVAALVAGCAHRPAPESADSSIAPFSKSPAGVDLPHGWERWDMARVKRPTEYRLVSDDGVTVVRAAADRSLSGLVCRTRIDLVRTPYLRWRWKVPAMIEGADNTRRHAEDAPARIVIAFEGDTAKLPFDDRLVFAQVKAITGQTMPYATLMYIWANGTPVDTVIPSHHTSRVKMIVADTGSANTGTWRVEVRNVAEDFRRAFGEAAPRVISVGVMTDTDNTGTRIEAFYGDIEFVAHR